MWFQYAKERPAKGQDMNALVARVVQEVLKKKRARDMATHNSGSEEKPKKFNFENLSIREE